MAIKADCTECGKSLIENEFNPCAAAYCDECMDKAKDQIEELESKIEILKLARDSQEKAKVEAYKLANERLETIEEMETEIEETRDELLRFRLRHSTIDDKLSAIVNVRTPKEIPPNSDTATILKHASDAISIASRVLGFAADIRAICQASNPASDKKDDEE